MNANTIVVDLAMLTIPASSILNDIVKKICPRKLNIANATTNKRFSHFGRHQPPVNISKMNVKTLAKIPKLQMTTE